METRSECFAKLTNEHPSDGFNQLILDSQFTSVQLLCTGSSV